MRQTQKKLASRMMKCGKDRVWIDPSDEKVKRAITRSDIRRFIKEGSIKKKPVKKKKTMVKKKRQGPGSRKGKYGARNGRKSTWLKIVRPQRKLLTKLREKEKINDDYYRKIYLLIKGGKFRTKKHMVVYLKEHNMFAEGEKK